MGDEERESSSSEDSARSKMLGVEGRGAIVAEHEHEGSDHYQRCV